MDIKKILAKSNIKVFGDKISKADYSRAMEVLSKLDKLEVGDTNVEGNVITIEMTASLVIKESFEERALDIKSKSLEELHELYESLDYVESEFNSDAVGLDIYNEIRGTLGIVDVDSAEVEINYWPSSLPKVEEKSFDEDLAAMMVNLAKFDVELEIKIHYSIDTTEIIKKCEGLISKALKDSGI